jgi:hypothetical protein
MYYVKIKTTTQLLKVYLVIHVHSLSDLQPFT